MDLRVSHDIHYLSNTNTEDGPRYLCYLTQHQNKEQPVKRGDAQSSRGKVVKSLLYR